MSPSTGVAVNSRSLEADSDPEPGMDFSSCPFCVRADQNATFMELCVSKYFFQATLHVPTSNKLPQVQGLETSLSKGSIL